MARRRIAVIGGGWAGLAAAVAATEGGAEVTLYEMAPHPGGRARSVALGPMWLDNGQHILIGAYTRTLALMQHVGADPGQLLMRMPLSLRDPLGHGLALPPGRAVPAFVRAVLFQQEWRLHERLQLLAAAARWRLAGFRCGPSLTVAALCAHLPASVRAGLIDPLCVAALNTPSHQASAAVFLRVLRDALFSGPGSADLLLPRVGLSALLPDPAVDWLRSRGAAVHFGQRVMALLPGNPRWQVNGLGFDAVVLACSAREAARLTLPLAPDWSRRTAALNYQPIVTAYLRDDRLRLAHPMVSLHADTQAPAQFVFDLGALGASAGHFAFVASGAEHWTDLGLAATGAAVIRQARRAFPGSFMAEDATVLHHLAAERRATFACTPGLDRPPARVMANLFASGDYVEGPYPATLEGAVRSGEQAAAWANMV